MKPVVDEGRWLATQPSTSEERLAERFRQGMAGDIEFVVLEEGGDIVGCAGTSPQGWGVWSLGMWLAAAHRGRGLGRRLLDAAIEAAAERGARKIELEVFSDNAPAIGLYRSAGFGIEDVKPDHYPREDGTVKSSIVMGLHLERVGG
jgi:ribosomal protein S18 acetylase RimI-like enzyme